MTTDEVAALLGIKPATIRRWRAEHRIPFIKLNGAVRYRESAISAWIEENSKPAMSDARARALLA